MITVGLTFDLKDDYIQRGFSQEEVAELIGVSARFYQMLESKNPTATTLDAVEKLAKAFKIRSSKLLEF